VAWLEFDRAIMLWINSLSGHLPVLDNVILSIANDYFAIITSCLVMMALWTGVREPENRRYLQKGIMVASASLGTSQGMVEIINNIWVRQRPFQELDVNLLFYAPTDPSFPSNSASVLFGLAWGIFFYNRKAGTILLAIAGIHGLSRIYVGVHYPLDILGGAALGFVVALFFLIAFRLLNPVLDRIINIMRCFFLA